MKNYINQLYAGAIIFPCPLATKTKDKFCDILVVEDGPNNYYTTCPLPMSDYQTFTDEVRRSYTNIEFVAWPALSASGNKAPRGVKLFLDYDYVENGNIKLIPCGTVRAKAKNASGEKEWVDKKAYLMRDVALVVKTVYTTSARCSVFSFNFNEEWALNRAEIRRARAKARATEKKVAKKKRVEESAKLYKKLFSDIKPGSEKKISDFKNVVSMKEIERYNKAMDSKGGKKGKGNGKKGKKQ